MTIITSEHYNEIRAAIDVSLTKARLSDDIICMPIYAGAAEQDVLNIVPDALSKTGDDLIKIERAAVFFCAARLVHSVVQLTSVAISVRDMNYSRPAYDPDERKAALVAMANSELLSIIEPNETTHSMPTMFATVCGRRGQ